MSCGYDSLFPTNLDFRPTCGFGGSQKDVSYVCTAVVGICVVAYLCMSQHSIPSSCKTYVSERVRSTRAFAKSAVSVQKIIEGKDCKKCYEKFKKEMLKDNKMAVMFYAPWCQHCHTALPRFKEMFKNGLIVNADDMPRESMNGKDPHCPAIQYFPSFFAKTGKDELVQHKTMDDVKSALDQSSVAPTLAMKTNAKVARAMEGTVLSFGEERDAPTASNLEDVYA